MDLSQFTNMLETCFFLCKNSSELVQSTLQNCLAFLGIPHYSGLLVLPAQISPCFLSVGIAQKTVFCVYIFLNCLFIIYFPDSFLLAFIIYVFGPNLGILVLMWFCQGLLCHLFIQWKLDLDSNSNPESLELCLYLFTDQKG